MTRANHTDPIPGFLATATMVLFAALFAVPTDAQASTAVDSTGPGAYERSMAAGRAAEQAGDQREALRHYTAAHRTIEQLYDVPDSLRLQIFRVAAGLRPPPALPDSAMIREVRAQLLFDSAKTPGDLTAAASEYIWAIYAAPWVGRFYHNVALIAERLGTPNHLRFAAIMMRAYLQSPDVQDRDGARRKLIALELLLERAVAEQSAESQLFAAFDEWVGNVQFYLKPLNSTSTLFGPCHLTEEHCAAIGRQYAGLQVNTWERGGNSEISRRGDTLIVGPGQGVHFGVARGPRIEDAAWFIRRGDKAVDRPCEGYEPSGEYPVHAAVITDSEGVRWLVLTAVHHLPAGMWGAGNICALRESSNYLYAFGPPPPRQ